MAVKPSKRHVIGAWAALLLLPAAGCGLFSDGGRTGAIRVSGNIEITDAELGFKLAGRVLERPVDEGELVKAGQLIARLESADIEREVAAKKADVALAAAALAELEAGSRPEEIAQAAAAAAQARSAVADLSAGPRPQEIESARAVVKSAEADAEKAALDFSRMKDLYEKSNVVSRNDFDVARTADEMARARLKDAREKLAIAEEGYRKDQVEQARQALQQAEANYTLVKKGPRVEEIEQGRARLQQAKEALALSETKLSYAILSSPMAGLVLSKNVEPGEFVSAGTPVVTVGDLAHPWVRAYVEETDLGRVKLGQSVRVTCDSYPGKVYAGKVVFISGEAEFTPKSVQTKKERVKLVYRIKVDIDNPALELKPGMPVDAEITTDEPKK
ncbi:MAG: efflux RND transporter periplasmic adaptor subunit [Acidobacteria bacterium]|nr:efflux RND transporter periplasmic adaptor subunit [Acidobacteriota bacterium]